MRGHRPLAVLLALGLSSVGCVLPTTSGTDAGAAPPPIDAGTTTFTGTAVGTGCGTDPTTHVTLCTGTTECPGVTVDPVVFPGCGFFISGTTLYLECLCSGYLCPMGTPATCAAASTLLGSTNEGIVCNQISTNGCEMVPGMTGSGTGTGTTDAGAGSGSGCDKTCEAMCAGEPDCIQLCGC